MDATGFLFWLKADIETQKSKTEAKMFLIGFGVEYYENAKDQSKVMSG